MDIANKMLITRLLGSVNIDRFNSYDRLCFFIANSC